MKLKLVYAQRKHFKYVVKHIDPMDAEEVMAACGLEPEESILQAFSAGHLENLAIVDEEGVACSVGGFSQNGLVWFIVTEEVSKFSLRDKLQVFRLIEQMRDHVLTNVHPVCYNTVYKKNTQHIKLLATLGATFEEIQTDNRFLLFTITKT